MHCPVLFRSLLLLPAFCLLSALAQPAAAANKSPVPVADTTILPTDTLLNHCPKGGEIEKIIDDAIAMGAPIYNAGFPLACYRIYEGASYKILYVYGKTCPDIEKVLKTAIDKSHGDYSDTEKAWIMRMAFDKIMGVPTQTKATEPNRVG